MNRRSADQMGQQQWERTEQLERALSYAEEALRLLMGTQAFESWKQALSDDARAVK